MKKNKRMMIALVLAVLVALVGVAGCGKQQEYRLDIVVIEKEVERSTSRVNGRTTTRTTYEVDASVNGREEEFRVSGLSLYNRFEAGVEYTVTVTGDAGSRRTIRGIVSTR